MVISDIDTDGLVSVAIVSLLMSSICTQYRDARCEHLRIGGHLQVKVRVVSLDGPGGDSMAVRDVRAFV
jgi:hypothetical protein